MYRINLVLVVDPATTKTSTPILFFFFATLWHFWFKTIFTPVSGFPFQLLLVVPWKCTGMGPYGAMLDCHWGVWWISFATSNYCFPNFLLVSVYSPAFGCVCFMLPRVMCEAFCYTPAWSVSQSIFCRYQKSPQFIHLRPTFTNFLNTPKAFVMRIVIITNFSAFKSPPSNLFPKWCLYIKLFFCGCKMSHLKKRNELTDELVRLRKTTMRKRRVVYPPALRIQKKKKNSASLILHERQRPSKLSPPRYT